MAGHGSRAAALLVVAVLVGGCSVPAASGSPLGTAGPSAPVPSERPSTDPGAATALPSGTAGASTAASGTAVGKPAEAVAAASWFLAQPGARFELAYDRFRPDEILRIATATGTVDPAGDRGTMRYDFFPEVAPDDPFRMSAEVAWTATDWWGSLPLEEPGVWTHIARADAPERANAIGRIQEEPLALVRFVADADPATIEALPAAELEGRAAERWLVPVPVALTEAAYVPSDSYLGFADVFDRDDLPLEAWLVDGRLVRLGYVLERDESPKGGPDRHETWYDWTISGDPIELVIPPVGEIHEIGE